MAKNYKFEALGLTGLEADEGILNVTMLAAHVLGCPIAFTSVLEPEKKRQIFCASTGLPHKLQMLREIPISLSICQFVKSSDGTIAISDLLTDDRTLGNEFAIDNSLRSYLGSPIHTVSGETVGALACMNQDIREWTSENIQTLEMLAECVDEVIKARASAVDARKAKKDLKKEIVARSGYVAHVSHEIRTPLQGIIGSIRLLKAVPLDDQAVRLVEVLDRSADRLLDFVNDVMTLRKIDAEIYHPVSDTCNLGNVVTDVLDTFIDLALIKSVTLVMDNLLPGRIYLMDRHAVTTVLQYLISNALKFTDAGFVKVKLKEDSYGQAVIEIIDSGIGIAPEYQEKIFDEFEQTGANTVRKQGGTGLGMTIVKRIVDDLEGDISLSSQLGIGTKFSVVLPLQALGSDEIEFEDVEVKTPFEPV
jgi:signal transduction histidine kinase